MLSALEELPLTDLLNSTESLLNTLIIQAINRGAITRCLMVFFMDLMLNADITRFPCVGFQCSCCVVSDPGVWLLSTSYIFPV